MQKLFGIGLTLSLMIGCVPSTKLATATETEVCRQWGNSLPTRSRFDTQQTSTEIQRNYAVFQLTCPELAQLVPKNDSSKAKVN